MSNQFRNLSCLSMTTLFAVIVPRLGELLTYGFVFRRPLFEILLGVEGLIIL